MLNFGFPALTWGFLLVLAPLLIHLINLLRHRRVKWAAMEFLLQSYKRHRKWVWLRQFLLLASRMAVIALLVAMLAQWKPQHRWFARFSGAAAHHYILLDDSYSMSQRIGDATAFDQALSVVRAVATRAGEQDGLQRVTLLRFTRAAQSPDAVRDADLAAQIADLNSELVDGRFEARLEEQQRKLSVSQLASGPLAALQTIKQLVDEDESPLKLVYLISDFSARHWENPSELREVLADLQSAKAEVELINCVRQEQPNLAIVELQPDAGPRVAGVPLFVNVTVKNYGQQEARQIQLKVRSHFFDDQQAAIVPAGQQAAQVEDLPVELIEAIPAGETVTQRVQVYFPAAGRHAVEAVLPDDVVPLDNRRWCAVTFQNAEPVLVVDGDPEQRNAYYLNSIFEPGPRANTGIQPRSVNASYLRDAPLAELQEYSVIYLLDLGRLENRAVENLDAYVQAGGGLAVFLGPQTDVRFFNDLLYRSGNGWFPFPIGQQELSPPKEADEPDINIEGSDHPVFRDLLAGRNPLIRLVHVNRYFSPAEGWSPPENSTVRVIAGLRSLTPLAVEKSVGDGRVVVFTTTFAPVWNDLALGPNALIALQLQAYLSQGRRAHEQRLVGSPVLVELNTEQHRRELQFVAPSGNAGDQRLVIDRQAEQPDPKLPVARATLGGVRSDTFAGETERAGIYEVRISQLGGSVNMRRYALNVDPAEGDLQQPDSKAVIASLIPARPSWRYADEMQFEDLNPANLPPSLQLMALLVGLLVAEQALGYAASYHTSPGGARA